MLLFAMLPGKSKVDYLRQIWVRGFAKSALPCQGKRGSTRTLVAKRHPHAIIFLVGREKSSASSDFSDTVVEAAKTIAIGLQRQNLEKLQELADVGQLKEICNDA